MEQNNNQTNPYDFILNNNQTKKTINFQNKRSILLLFSGGAVFIIIIIIVLSSIFAGPAVININSYTKTLQDQAEIVHLTSEVMNNTFGSVGLPVNLNNTTATTNVSLASQQSNMISYLKLNGYTISLATINLGINQSLDKQLTADYSNQTFKSSYQNELTSLLNQYLTDLSTAYKLSTGPKGRIMLKSDYNSIGLIQKTL